MDAVMSSNRNNIIFLTWTVTLKLSSSASFDISCEAKAHFDWTSVRQIHSIIISVISAF